MTVNDGNGTGRVHCGGRSVRTLSGARQGGRREDDRHAGMHVEPAIGFEPMTYRLQGDCSAN